MNQIYNLAKTIASDKEIVAKLEKCLLNTKIIKVFANGQVWKLWKGVDYINETNTVIVGLSYLQEFADFEHLVIEGEPTLQRTETP